MHISLFWECISTQVESNSQHEESDKYQPKPEQSWLGRSEPIYSQSFVEHSRTINTNLPWLFGAVKVSKNSILTPLLQSGHAIDLVIWFKHVWYNQWGPCSVWEAVTETQTPFNESWGFLLHTVQDLLQQHSLKDSFNSDKIQLMLHLLIIIYNMHSQTIVGIMHWLVISSLL